MEINWNQLQSKISFHPPCSGIQKPVQDAVNAKWAQSLVMHKVRLQQKYVGRFCAVRYDLGRRLFP